MKHIKLTQDKYALVDDGDYPSVILYRWCFDGMYAASRINGRKVRLHRWLLNEPEELQVDHKNLNKLDCRRENLRVATNAENARNKRAQSSNTSGHKGVHWNKNAGKWQAQTKVNGIRHHLGYFIDIEDAVVAYREAISKYHGEFAHV